MFDTGCNGIVWIVLALALICYCRGNNGGCGTTTGNCGGCGGCR